MLGLVWRCEFTPRWQKKKKKTWSMVYSQKQQLGVDTRQSAKEHKASELHDELDWESCHLGLLTFW